MGWKKGHGQVHEEERRRVIKVAKNELVPWPDVIEKAGPVDSPARVVGLVAGPRSGAVSLFCNDVTFTLH